jgi:hypothetical protein
MLPFLPRFALAAAVVMAAVGCSDAAESSPSRSEVIAGVSESDEGDQLSVEQEECIADVLIDNLADDDLRAVVDGEQPQEVSEGVEDAIRSTCGAGADQGPATSDVSVSLPDQTETTGGDPYAE